MKNTHQPTPERHALTGGRHLLPLALLLISALVETRAAIPSAALSDPLYAKGYLKATYYNGVSPAASETDATRTTRTIKINEALADAYNSNLALYFPAGTYEVNDTLKAYTAFVNSSGSAFAVPRNAIAVVGSTLKIRPTIKLVPASGDTKFNSAVSPHPIFAFKNFSALPPANEDDDAPSSGFFQMLRGIDIDCGGKAGAIGLYFNQAQNSSIENVKVIATDAHTGIRGLPARGWGVVNIEVVGGQYGIDTNGTGNAGSVIAGATLTGQSLAAFRHDGFVPVTLVGFKITSPPNSTAAVLTIQPSTSENSCGINLVDGSIEMDTNPSVAVIDNGHANNFYARNVYIKTGTVSAASNLVKSGALATVTATGEWKLIDEYSYCTAAVDNPPGAINRASYRQINTTLTLGAGEMKTITPSLPAPPPADLASRHAWAALPSVDDPDAVDVTAPPSPFVPVVRAMNESDPTVVNSAHLQAIIDAHRKVFLPKGIYRLTAPGITLRADTILFGAARSLTRIEVDGATWNPTVETPIIQTDNDANATTYLGDLTIGVDTAVLANDYFTALNWKAGRGSMVHMGQPYRRPDAGKFDPTNDHSLLKIEQSGGGRWYFAGCIKTGNAQHALYRILEVIATSEPLSFYGLNLEHALGSAVFAEFKTASNIRIYALKSEFDGTGVSPLRGNSVLIRFSNASSNVALYGSGAIRNAVINHGVIEFINSDKVLATLIAPQNNNYDVGLGPNNHTLRQTIGSNTHGVEYPNIVSYYRRGLIEDSAMTHGNPFYGPERVFTSLGGVEDGWAQETSETSGLGGTVVTTGTGGQALLVGDSTGKQQYKSIVSFDTSPLPLVADATIVAATLELCRGSVAGAFASGNLTALGGLRADIKTGNYGTLPDVQSGDFQVAGNVANVATGFQVPPVNLGWAIGALSSASFGSINRGGKTQFRVYFATDDNNNATADTVGFYSGDHVASPGPAGKYHPVLRVQYRQP